MDLSQNHPVSNQDLQALVEHSTAQTMVVVARQALRTVFKFYALAVLAGYLAVQAGRPLQAFYVFLVLPLVLMGWFGLDYLQSKLGAQKAYEQRDLWTRHWLNCVVDSVGSSLARENKARRSA